MKTERDIFLSHTSLPAHHADFVHWIAGVTWVHIHSTWHMLFHKSIKLMCKEAHAFTLNTWGVEERELLKSKIISATLKFLNHCMRDPSRMI